MTIFSLKYLACFPKKKGMLVERLHTLLHREICRRKGFEEKSKHTGQLSEPIVKSNCV
jgi:hypothetical protein